MTDFINSFSNALCDLLLLPFRGGSPWTAMIGVSLATGAASALLFKYCSNQAGLRRAKDQALGRVMELWLYRDDFAVSLGSFARILKSLGGYLITSLKPVAIAILPLCLLAIQLATWFEYRPLQPGEQALVKVKFKGSPSSEEMTAKLSSSDNLEIETEGLRIPSERQINWRIRAKEKGTGWVEVSWRGDLVRKRVETGDGLAKIARKRVMGGWPAVLHPAEDALPAGSSIERIELTYRESRLALAGYDIHWLAAFVVLSLLFGWCLKYPLKVEF